MALHDSSHSVSPASQIDTHPGHWTLHHIALPGNMPGDFTPVRPHESAEDETSLHRELLRYLAEFMLTTGAAQRLAERQADAEAGQ